MSSPSPPCPHCGKPTLPDARLCAYCGASLVSETHKVQSRAVPVPDRADLSGPCAVICAGREETDVRRVGRSVAEFVGKPLPDVTRQIKKSKGFLAQGLEPEDAVRLAEQVEAELGCAVLVIPEAACVPLPPAMRMRHVSFDASGLACEAYTWTETDHVRATWDDVFLVSCARLELQEVAEKANDSNKGKRRSFLSPPDVPELVTRTYHEYLLDVVLLEPRRRLRLDQNTVAFSMTEMAQDPALSAGALYHNSTSLMQLGRGVPMNRGVALLASRAADSEWEPLTFFNKRDFDSYTYWLAQLVRYGHAIPA